MDKKVMNEMLELLSPTEKQKKRMLHNIFAREECGTAAGITTGPASVSAMCSASKRIRPAFVAAVICCCLLTTTAFAAVLGMDGKFLSFLKPGDEQQAEYLAHGVFNVDEKIVEPNGTLEIKQVIGDDNLTYILMDFTAPEGTTLNAEQYIFEEQDFSAGEGSYSVDLIQAQDDDPGDNKISLIFSVISDQPTQGAVAQVRFTNLLSGPAQKGTPYTQFETVANGTWEATIPLKYQNYSSAYTVGKTVTLYGYEATVRMVSVSPISVALQIESPNLREINQAIQEDGGLQELAGHPYQYKDPLPVRINYEDGTSEITQIFNGMAQTRYVQNDVEINEMLLVKTFDQVINDREISAIDFFDLRIPLVK